MKKKEVLYVLLDKYAAHEMVFLSQAINDGEMGPRECPKYKIKWWHRAWNL